MKSKLSRFAVPYVVWMAIFVVAPIVIMVVYAFAGSEGGFTLDNFVQMGGYAAVFGRSFKLALIATAICLLLGYPVAYLLSREGERFRRTAMVLIMLPMWMNFLLRTYSWMTILENNGLLNQLFQKLGIIALYNHLTGSSLEYFTMIDTQGAVVLGMVYNYLPFMILPIYSVICKLDYSLLEAARDLGANTVTVFRKVILPLSLPGVLSGITMVFVPSVSTFAISRMLGGGTELLLGDLIERQFLGGADFDVIVPSDYMIARLIQEDMLAELDYGAIPNFQLMDPQFTHLSFDPENKYTVPYTWGSVGIIYNTTMVDEPITSWGAMFDEKYAGQVLMINNSRDALMAALCYLGYDINTTDEGQLTEAFELVKNAKDKGVYQAFVMDEVFGKMEGGNAAITMYYAGDYLTMLENNEDLAFVIPEEGSNWFVDAMCVLKSSQHKAEAYEWINFIASTDSNLANMDYIWYASPNAEALAEYPAYYEEQYGEPLDEEIYNIMAIPDEERERCEIYVNLPQETLKFYDKLWTQLGV